MCRAKGRSLWQRHASPLSNRAVIAVADRSLVDSDLRTRNENIVHDRTPRSRIAPAVLLNPITIASKEMDGDLVTVKTTKGRFAKGDFTFNSAFDTNAGQ